MTMATNVESVVSILDKIDAQSLGHDAAALLQLTTAAKKLVARLESPFMQILETSVVPVQLTSALQVISDMGLWEAWRRAGGKEATLFELKEMCSVPCDTVFLRESASCVLIVFAQAIVLTVYLRPSSYISGCPRLGIGDWRRPMATYSDLTRPRGQGQYCLWLSHHCVSRGAKAHSPLAD